MSQKQSETAGTDASTASKNPMGFVIGAALGVVALVVLWSATNKSPMGGPGARALPHLAVMVEIDDLNAHSTRQLLANFDRELRATGCRVSGPASLALATASKAPGPANPNGEDEKPTDPELPPGATPEGEGGVVVDLPKLVRLRDAAEFEVAYTDPFLATAGYYRPRVLDAEGKRVLFRIVPRDGLEFGPDVAKQVKELVASSAEFFPKGIHAYSQALGLTDSKARDAINAHFGVEATVVMLFFEDATTIWTVEGQEKIRKAVDEFESPLIKTRVSPGAFLQYAHAVNKKTSNPPPPTAEEFSRIQLLAQTSKVPLLISQDGKYARVELGTTAEGKAAMKLAISLAKKLDQLPGMTARVVIPKPGEEIPFRESGKGVEPPQPFQSQPLKPGEGPLDPNK